MKNVELKFNDIWVDVEDGWLCIGDGENQILLRPEYFKKLLKAINYSPCCKSDSEQLKGKYPLTFAKWRESNGYTPYDNSSYQKDNKIINVDKLEIKYRAYYKTF